MISIDFPLPCSKNLFILGSPWLFNLGSSILRLLLHLQTSADSAFHAPNPQGVRDLIHLGKMAMFRVNLALIVKNSQWIIGRKWLSTHCSWINPLFDAYRSTLADRHTLNGLLRGLTKRLKLSLAGGATNLETRATCINEDREAEPYFYHGQNMVVRGHASHMGNP